MSISHVNEVLSDPERLSSLKQRFARKVRQGGQAECWPWVAKAIAKYGYGRMTAGRGRYLRAHQVAWALVHGPIPDGAAILHKCDNPACCNPDHLFLGTQAENMADANGKGRMSLPPRHRADKHPKAKLGWAQVEAIRADARPAHVIAAEYGVSEKTVYRHRRREVWKQE